MESVAIKDAFLQLLLEFGLKSLTNCMWYTNLRGSIVSNHTSALWHVLFVFFVGLLNESIAFFVEMCRDESKCVQIVDFC